MTRAKLIRRLRGAELLESRLMLAGDPVADWAVAASATVGALAPVEVSSISAGSGTLAPIYGQATAQVAPGEIEVGAIELFAIDAIGEQPAGRRSSPPSMSASRDTRIDLAIIAVAGARRRSAEPVDDLFASQAESTEDSTLYLSARNANGRTIRDHITRNLVIRAHDDFFSHFSSHRGN
jgi:hypothetical protein